MARYYQLDKYELDNAKTSCSSVQYLVEGAERVICESRSIRQISLVERAGN